MVVHALALALAHRFAHAPRKSLTPSTATSRRDETRWVLIESVPVAPPPESTKPPRRVEARIPRSLRASRALVPGPRVPTIRAALDEPRPTVVVPDELGDVWTPLAGERADSSMNRPYGGARLATFVDLESTAPPAPTTTPRRRRITPAEVSEAVRAVTRSSGRGLGLESPHEGVIAHAVQEAGRATPVPSGTRFEVRLVLDREGHVADAAILGDSVGERAWADTLDRIRTLLPATRIPVGIDTRSSETRVTVHATVLHVFPSGTTGAPVVGDCPQLPQIGGETQPSFFAIGGSPYLEHPSGTCLLGDLSDAGAHRVIVVRTRVSTHYGLEAPPPASTFPMPRPKKLLPGIPELIAMLIDAK